MSLVSPSDFDLCKAWITEYLSVLESKNTGNKLPFGFEYDDKKTETLFPNIPAEVYEEKLIGKKRYTVKFVLPETKLQVKCVLILYNDYPTIEWTLFLKNTGDTDTGIISNLMPISAGFGINETDQNTDFILNHHTGSPNSADDYRPHRTTLMYRQAKRISTCGGRPVNSDFPYFNLEYAGRGVILALGWAGQWALNFFVANKKMVFITGGQELTRFKLFPGEEVRNPMVVLQFWHGENNRTRSQNVWRRWMLEHNMLRNNGKPLEPMCAGCSSLYYAEMVQTNETWQKFFLDRYLEEGIKINFWWMDAGWYPVKKTWHETGTWEVDKTRFPGGLRSITDYAHKKGVNSIVWFEPERVTPGTWLYENHPEWLLGLGKDGEWKLLNLGNADARSWWVEHADKVINEQGIDLYRTDFNIEPLNYWRANDTPCRQGITEIRYVEGLYAYLDELLRRHPGMLIDICASGGRRNDVETLRRGVPLLRSDYIFNQQAQQQHTYSISSWIPYYGTGFWINKTGYLIRSVLTAPFIIYGYDMRDKTQDYNTIREVEALRKRITKLFLGDYYPLTPYINDNNHWLAWQFNCPSSGEGVLQAFIRENTAVAAMKFRLYGLEREAVYEVEDIDKKETVKLTGSELMDTGLLVTPSTQPSAIIMFYKKVI